jgi:hypothetical protein
MKNVDKNDKIVDRRGAFAAIRHLSFAIILGLFCLLLAANSFAQSANRWLFIFNTSASMRNRTNGMQAETQDLLTTAMHGNLRPGDTIGIWTYNSELHADEAPLQTWSPKTAPAIAYNTVLFLQQHAYGKSASFDDVLANLLRVVKISDTITIILISDGTDAIKGTPFDAQLASFYKTNYSAQKIARMPVITVLRGEKGALTTNSLALGPWPVDIPQVPPPAPVKAAAKKPAVVVTPPPPPKPVPSLVIIGKKAETTFNVPTDLPDHSGDLPDQPPTAAAPTEPAPVVTTTETPTMPAPETAPVKVDEKPLAPAAAATPPAIAPAPTSTAVETAKAVQPTESNATAASESKEPPLTKATESPKVEATATAPQNELFSARNIAIISVVFTLLVCTLLILNARNARRAVRTSLITRSLDREQR